MASRPRHQGTMESAGRCSRLVHQMNHRPSLAHPACLSVRAACRHPSQGPWLPSQAFLLLVAPHLPPLPLLLLPASLSPHLLARLPLLHGRHNASMGGGRGRCCVEDASNYMPPLITVSSPASRQRAAGRNSSCLAAEHACAQQHGAWATTILIFLIPCPCRPYRRILTCHCSA